MKKTPIVLGCLLLLLSVITGCGSRHQEKISGDFTYEIVDGTAIITKYNNLSTTETLVIPDTLDGHPVSVIDGFGKAQNLKEVILPNTVQIIDSYAFNGCANLQVVHLNEGILQIASCAFKDCVSLKEFSFPTSLERINSEAFKGCSSLISITGGSGLQTIEKDAFFGTSWQDAQPNVLSYGGLIFGYKDSDAFDEILELPPDTRRIMPQTFQFVDSVKHIILPDSIEYLGASSFYSMKDLEHVVFGGGNRLRTIEANVFADCSALTSVDLSSVTLIGEDMFWGCKNLSSVRADAVTTVGASAFSGCRALTQYRFPAVTRIEDFGFSGTGITELNLPEGIQLGESVFQDCSALTSATIPVDVSYGCFSGCTSLANVTLADGCAEVGPKAFHTRQPMTVHVSDTVTRIASNAFGDIGKKSINFIGTSEYAKIYAYNHKFYLTEDN